MTNIQIEIFNAKKKYPKENKWVIALDDNNYHFPEWYKAFYKDGKWYSERAEEYKQGTYTYTELYNVTHWANLPDIQQAT